MFGQKMKKGKPGSGGEWMKGRFCAVLLALCVGLSACQPAAGAEGELPKAAAMQQEAGLENGEDQENGSSQEDGSAKDDGVAQGSGSLQENGDQASEEDSQSAPDVMEVHFIDVGQGDSTLIKCGGQTLLIDAATADKGTAIQNYLTKQGVEKLDYLILTHPDSDHIGAAAVIITKFEIGQVFVSNFEKDNSTYRKMIQALDDKRLKAEVPKVGSTFTLGSAVCTVLAPNRTYDDPNDASVALLVQNGENRFLFTGDAQEEAEEDILANGLDLKADVYKAGHHGSRTSSCEELLDAVEPEFAVISCGEGNSYGHPHAQVLNSLRARDIKVYRTDEQGSLIASSDGTSITWNAAPSDTWQAGEPTGSSSKGSQQTSGATGSGGAADKEAGNSIAPSQQAAAGQEQQDGQKIQESGQAGQGAQTGDQGGQAGQGAQAGDQGGQDGQGAQNGQQEAQPQVSQQAPEDNQIPAAVTYVLNTKTKKFHRTSCSYLPTANRQDTDQSRDEIIEQGYEPCKKCNP